MEEKNIMFDGYKGEFVDPNGIAPIEDDNTESVELSSIEFDEGWE